MSKKVKNIFSLILVLVLMMSLFSTSAYAVDNEEAPANQNQIIENQKDVIVNGEKVSISKSLEGTDIENVFDITLKVITEENISKLYEDPDIAVAIVMDISGSMCLLPKDNKGQQYKDAVSAAKGFINDYCNDARKEDGTPKNAIRDLALITFNTNATVQQGLTNCTDSNANFDNAFANIDNMVMYNGADFNDAYRVNSHDRFTNIEAGLKLGQNVLNQSKSENKFIILLTDGYPTTYYAGHNSNSTTSINGYDPYVSIGNIGDDGNFYDALTEKPCKYGTSYSDKAALYTKNAADVIDNDGTTIFTVGINIGGQNISTMQRNTTFSVVDCFVDNNSKGTFDPIENSAYINNDTSTYIVGSNQGQYETWLKNNISTNSSYYASGDNLSALNAAYEDFANTISSIISTAAKAKWVVSDPMGENVEFLKFYNKENSLVDSIIGSNIENGENDAKYTNGISWDIKNSGYETITEGDTTKYIYTLKYRVRLQNENNGFVENSKVKTNGETVLKYQWKETVDGTTKLTDKPDLTFPEPSVKGYLEDLTFTKTAYGKGLPGAEFTLSHDENCSVCNAISKNVSISDIVAYSEIAENGEAKVTFNNIPSGHIYTLKETNAPTGYAKSNNEYRVTVAYDVLKVEKIENVGDHKTYTTINPTEIDMDNKLELNLDVSKTLLINSDYKIPDKDQFKFELLDENKKPVKNSDNTPVQATNNEYGEVQFHVLLDKIADSYTFYIREVNDNQFGIVYDTTVYKVIANRAEDGNASYFQILYYIDGKDTEEALEIAHFVNTYLSPKDLTVKKIWNNDTGSTNPESVLVQLYKNGQPYIGDDRTPGIVELRGENTPVNSEPTPLSTTTDTQYPVGYNWTYTWEGLDGAATWTVKELVVPSGYKVSYNTDKETGNIIITNTKTTEYHPSTTFRTVKKVWSDNDNEANKRPTDVIVQLMKNGTPYRDKVVLNESNGWGYTWTGLPLSGKYEVIEVKVPTDYTASITNDTYSFTITNTYTGKEEPPIDPSEPPKDPSEPPQDPGDKDKPEIPKDTNKDPAPKTGDTSNIGLSLLAFVLSGTGLYAVSRKRKRN